MSLREKLLIGLVIMGCLYLIASGRLSVMNKPVEEARLLSPATDITDLPKTRHLSDVTKRIIEIRKAELVAAHRLDPKKVFIKTKGEPVLNKFEEFYTVTFEIDIKGVRGLYAERYTVRTTKKRVFNITDVQYDHKCTQGKTVQTWTIEPCDIKANKRKPGE